MKTLFIIPLFLMLFSCNSRNNGTQPGKNGIAEEKPDTIIGVQVVPADLAGEDNIEKEYYAVVKSDTSGFSCIISQDTISGRMLIHYTYNPYRKMPTSISPGDTATVFEQESVEKFHRTSTYKDQMRELELMLNAASKDYDLSKLNSIRLIISAVNGLSDSVTKQYISQYGEKFPLSSNQKVVDLIENSGFTTDLNSILSPYSVIINKISVEDLMYYVPLDTPKGTKPTLNGIIICSIAPLH